MRRILLGLIVACGPVQDAPNAPEGALLVQISIDSEGFRTEGGALNELVLPADRDVVLEVTTDQDIASFSVPDHEIRVLSARERLGRALVRTFPCVREGGCRFRAIAVLGTGGLTREGRLTLMPESTGEPSTNEPSENEPSTNEPSENEPSAHPSKNEPSGVGPEPAQPAPVDSPSDDDPSSNPAQ